jgi:SAM-dependent methyltransferase
MRLYGPTIGSRCPIAAASQRESAAILRPLSTAAAWGLAGPSSRRRVSIRAMVVRATNPGEEAGYDRYGEAYRDWMAPIVAPAAVRLLDRLDGWPPPDELLDVGTGTGTLVLAALERWPLARATAVDQSGLMLRLARDEAQRRGGRLADRLSLARSAADQLPAPDASVDVVLSSFVIQLVPNRSAALREMRRVLRPAGTIALLTWQADDDPFEPDEIVQLTLDELDIETPPDGGGARPYTTPSAAAAELRRIGFDRVQARREWLDHQFTPRGYLDLIEHWIEDDLFTRLDEPLRAQLRARLLGRLEGLDAEALRWRRPLVSVVARRA